MTNDRKLNFNIHITSQNNIDLLPCQAKKNAVTAFDFVPFLGYDAERSATQAVN